MTIEKVIATLNGIPTTDEEHKALMVAIRSLEAWEKVKAEIQSLADEDWNKKVGTESGGLETAFEIIDKYVAESEDAE